MSGGCTSVSRPACPVMEPADPQVWSSPLDCSLCGGVNSPLSPAKNTEFRLTVSQLQTCERRGENLKHGDKSPKTWRWWCAVRAGSLPPISGASFFIHGETVREAWLSIGPGGLLLLLLLFQQKLSSLACSHTPTVCLRSGAAPPDHCSSSPARRLCFVSVVFFPFFSPGGRFPPRVGSRCPPPQTDPRMLLALKW